MSRHAAAAAADSSAAASSGTKRSFPGATTDPDRRVQPRHFHFGPNPGAASSAREDAAAEEPDRLPPAARLYRHALESIFGFLKQRELVTAMQVSKSWLAAVKLMASLRLTLTQTSAPLCEVAGSVIGRHVTQLGSEGKSVSLTADSLCILARHMAHLRVLFGEIQLASSKGRLTFPRGLQQLDLSVTKAVQAAELNAILLGIGRLHELNHLTILLPFINDQLSFAPLSSLPLLRELAIDQLYGDVELSDAQVAELRALPLLQELDVRPMSASLMRRLLAQPHELQWQQIRLPETLDDEAAALLPQLPSLTELHEPTMVATCSNFDFLRRLPQLTHVVLRISEPSAAGRIDSLVAGLQHRSQIEVLGLASSELTAVHLADLLPGLPSLRSLSLGNGAVTTLAFLAQPSMTQQLTRLQLRNCERLPLTELRHVHALRALKELYLHESFNEPMDTMHQMLHTPPSVLLPQLHTFEYTPPLDADQNDHEDENEAEEAEGDVGNDEDHVDE